MATRTLNRGKDFRRATLQKPGSLLFLLPNLFTVSSIFCGFYAIIQVVDGSWESRFFRAAIAIIFAVIFDSVDGRVARMTKTQTEFGIQLDSLADIISFGLAPAMIMYKWALEPFGLIGMLTAFVYIACGTLRLARFNVIATREKRPPKYFIGLPIPMAAMFLVSLVLLHHRSGGGELRPQPLMILVMVLLSGLMVSQIRYRSAKQIKHRRRACSALFLTLLLTLVAAWKTSLSLVLVVGCALIVSMGPMEELVRLLRRRLTTHDDDKVEENKEETV